MPIVETGMFVPSVEIWPEGSVRLLAVRIPVTCPTEMPVSVSFAGSRVTTACVSRPPVRSTVATPSMPRRAGTTSSRATCAAASRPSSLVPATEAMITGDALMLSARTCGVTLWRQAGRLEVLLDRRADLLDVGPELELGHDDRDRVGRGRREALEARHAGHGALDRLGDLLGDVGRADARIRRDDGDDREVDVGEQLLLEAAPGRDAGDEEPDGEQERDAPLRDGELGEAIHEGLPPVVVVGDAVAALDDGVTAPGPAAAVLRRRRGCRARARRRPGRPCRAGPGACGPAGRSARGTARAGRCRRR